MTPPVRAAMPAGLAGSPKGLTKGAPRSLALDPSHMKSRFFTEGPTSIFRLLALVDSSIGEINARIAGGGAPCLASEPVAYTLSPFGAAIPFFAQCYPTGPNGFVQFGQMNGANVYEVGSSDMGSTCNEPATACVSASDVLVPGTCGLVVEKFVLGALGRVASAGATGKLAASGYPGEPLNTVLLDGSATDSVTFGPTAPVAGVLELGR